MFRPSSTAYRDQNLVPMRSSACTASAGNSSSAAATPATGIGAALTRPLRIQERTAAMPARSHAGNGSTAERQQAIGANSRRHAASRPRFAHPVGAWRAATDARVLHLRQDLQHLGGVIEDRVAHNGHRLRGVFRHPAGRHRVLQPLGR